MIIDCVSDLHGNFPPLSGGDLLIVAGDVGANTPHGLARFLKWMESQPYRQRIFIAGNHDNALAYSRLSINKNKEVRIRKGDFVYLQDSGTEFDGLRIWGTPWTRWFDGVNPNCRAFMKGEARIAKRFERIPEGTDILISHMPPYGVLDAVMPKSTSGFRDLHVGSRSLLQRIVQIKPALCVFGHIHEHGGKTVDIESTRLVNASLLDETCAPVNKSTRVIIEL